LPVVSAGLLPPPLLPELLLPEPMPVLLLLELPVLLLPAVPVPVGEVVAPCCAVAVSSETTERRVCASLVASAFFR